MIIGWQCMGCYTRYEIRKDLIGYVGNQAPKRCQVCNEAVFTRLERPAEGSDGLYPERKPEALPVPAQKYEDDDDHSYGYGRNLLENPDMDTGQRAMEFIKEDIRRALEPLVGHRSMTGDEVSGKKNLVLTEVGIWMIDSEIKIFGTQVNDIEWTLKANKQEVASGVIISPHVQNVLHRLPPVLMEVKNPGTIVEFDVQSTGLTSRKLIARKI
jgi:hypothetical protein